MSENGRFIWRTPEEIMLDAAEVLNDPTLSDEMRTELAAAMAEAFPYTGPSIEGTQVHVEPDGSALCVGPVEGDAVKEQILADFCRQIGADDE